MSKERGSRGGSVTVGAVNGFLAGVGSLYLVTHSVLITVLGGALAVVLVASLTVGRAMED